MKFLLFLNIAVILNIQLICGQSNVQQYPDGSGNVLLVEEIVEKPAPQEYKELFGECFQDGCTTDQCPIDFKRLETWFMKLLKKDPMGHAIAVALLEPCILKGMKKYRDPSEKN